MNKCRASKMLPILAENKFVLDCKEKAELFNKIFAAQCTPLNNNISLPAFLSLTENKLDTIRIAEEDILSIIRSINPKKSNGPDQISGHMLRIADDALVTPLKLIFMNILRTSTYPALWKQANVTPVHKKGDKQEVKNYRPISLLSLFGKIFEKIVFKDIYAYLISNQLITENQSGFRPGDSTTNQLLFLISEIHKCFEHPKSLEVRAVFLDISKAFDKVWHEGLLFKLSQNGIHGNLLKLLRSYLDQRRQRVVINGSQSEYIDIKSGVPQGSVLGPLLFLIYINDLEKNIKSNVKFYADDTMLYSLVKDVTVSAEELNHDLEVIRCWAYQWKMQFNPDPTKQANEIVFSCILPLYLMGTSLLSLRNINI